MELEQENEKECEKKYIVRVMCQGKLMFVQFSDNELNSKSFPEKGKFLSLVSKFKTLFLLMYFKLISVANIFGIKFDAVPYSGLILTDNLGFPIPKHMFTEIVKTYHNGSMFYVNVEYQISSSLQGNLFLVTESVRFN